MKFNNLENMDKFLETCNLPRINHEEMENLNRLINSEETETMIKNLPQNKSPWPDVFTSKFYQKIKDLISFLLKLFPKTEEAILPNIFYEANIMLLPKSGKNNARK